MRPNTTGARFFNTPLANYRDQGEIRRKVPRVRTLHKHRPKPSLNKRDDLERPGAQSPTPPHLSPDWHADSSPKPCSPLARPPSEQNNKLVLCCPAFRQFTPTAGRLKQKFAQARRKRTKPSYRTTLPTHNRLHESPESTLRIRFVGSCPALSPRNHERANAVPNAKIARRNQRMARGDDLLARRNPLRSEFRRDNW